MLPRALRLPRRGFINAGTRVTQAMRARTPVPRVRRSIVSCQVNSVMRTIMLTDRYGLPLSTTSSAVRDAYVEGCEAKLTMYPGALEAFDRAIAADPGFALAHAAKAHALLERGDAAAARTSMAAANSLIAGLSAREASHIEFSTCFRRATPKPRSLHWPRT